ANKHDLADGKASGLSDAILDRIMLDEDRIRGIVEGVNSLIKLVDPVGEVFETVEKENGLLFEKTRVPIGVIVMIYEARRNVTIDAATLAHKAGNTVIIIVSYNAIHSNKILVDTLHKELEKSEIPKNAVQLNEDTSRDTAKKFFKLNDY